MQMKFRIFGVRNKKSTESLVRKGYLFLSSVKMVHPLCILVTCSKAVLDLEASPLQLFITEEADPHEASARQDESRSGWSAEAIDERGETKGTVPHFDVVEATFERRLDVEDFVKHQLYSLARQGWGTIGTLLLSEPIQEYKTL